MPYALRSVELFCGLEKLLATHRPVYFLGSGFHTLFLWVIVIPQGWLKEGKGMFCFSSSILIRAFLILHIWDCWKVGLG